MDNRNLVLLLICCLALISCRRDEDDLVGPFKDKLPVTFRYNTYINLTPTYIHTGGVTSQYTVSNREAVLSGKISRAVKQVDFIRITSSDKAQIYGAVRDGTPITLDAKYTQSGNNYIFNSNYLVGDINYTATRHNDTMVLKGISAGHYNNDKVGDEGAYIQVKGYTLQDAIARLNPGDTLYYKLFDVLLIKEK